MPIKKGRRKKLKSQNSSSALFTSTLCFVPCALVLCGAFEKVINNDPTTQLMSFFKEENQRAREHELKLMELFMSQRQPAVSCSTGPSSMISPERSPSPFAGPSYSAGPSSMISPERSPSLFAGPSYCVGFSICVYSWVGTKPGVGHGLGHGVGRRVGHGLGHGLPVVNKVKKNSKKNDKN